jgi:hypothetical protein
LALKPQAVPPHTQSLSLDKPRIVIAVCCSAAFGVATRHTHDPGAGARVSHVGISLAFRSKVDDMRTRRSIEENGMLMLAPFSGKMIHEHKEGRGQAGWSTSFS